MFKPSFPLALTAVLLAGCQSATIDPDSPPKLTQAQEKEQAVQRGVYEKLISSVLAREGDLANAQGRDGSFNLMLTLDDKNPSLAAALNPTRKWMPGFTPTIASWLWTCGRSAGQRCSPSCPRH